MRYCFITLCIIFSFHLNAQNRIKMEKSDGIYKIPCQVNGLRMKFYFDTGASFVSISLKEALFMLENDYLSTKDIVGTGKSTIADGSIVENTIINLRELKIGDKVLRDVKASVSKTLSAPILLGQSALKRLGGYKIEGDYLILQSGMSSNEGEDLLREQAFSAYKQNAWIVAENAYEKLYNRGFSTSIDILRYAGCCVQTRKPERVIEILSILSDDVLTSDSAKIYKYSTLGYAYGMIGDEHNCRLYSQLMAMNSLKEMSTYPKLGLIEYFVHEDIHKVPSLCNECLKELYNNSYDDLSSYCGGMDYNKDMLVFFKYSAMLSLAQETSDNAYITNILKRFIELSNRDNPMAKEFILSERLHEVFKPCNSCNGTGKCILCSGKGSRSYGNCTWCSGIGSCHVCHGSRGTYVVERY